MNSLEVKNIFEIINTLKYFNEYLVQKKKFFQMEYVAMENIQNKIQEKKLEKKKCRIDLWDNIELF